MTALKNCTWEVTIRQIWDNKYYFLGVAKENNGIGFKQLLGKSYKLRSEAIKNWEDFAKTNNIKKYKIK